MSGSPNPSSIREGERESRVAVQDYVKVIWSASHEREGGEVPTGEIAEQLGVSPASVSGMIRRLEADGLVEREPYRGVRLTEHGRSVALEVVRHHRLLESFLARALGMPWDRIHAEAEVLEHHISEELEELIDAYLDYPEFDPHGHPIPRRDGTVPDRQLAVLASCTIGDTGVVEQIRNESPEVLRFLGEHQLGVGATLTLTGREPAIDTVTVETADGASVVIGMGLAARIDVRVS